MNRRHFIASLPALAAALAAARSVLAAAGGGRSRLGFAAFSCHQHWKAVREGAPGVRFGDARGFYDYARTLGGDGVQTSLRGVDADHAKALAAHVAETGGYFEGDIALPGAGENTDPFEMQVRLARDAGAVVARAVLTGTRRYEGFKTLAEFREFQAQGERRLAAVAPILARHRLKLAIENHKDHTAPELAALLRRIDSEWIGATVDTGNNIALLEDPQEVVGTLAPFAFTVHLKDMAVQPYGEGFLLSEVPLGAGFLDLPRMIATLRKANPAIVFNIEMATRDPLKVPCRTDAYWTTFGGRREADLANALERVRQNPPKEPPPAVAGKSPAEILADEEKNNRRCAAARPRLGL